MTNSSSLSFIEKAAQVKKLVTDALRNQELTSHEVENILRNISAIAESDQEHIVRGMELPAPYRTAGLSLLSFFPQLIELQHPAFKVKSIIEQEKERVKFILEVEPNHRQTVETALEQYSNILLRNIPMNILAKDEQQLMQFKRVLDLSALEVSISRDIPTDDLEGTSDALEAFEQDVMELHRLVGQGLGNMHDLQRIIASLLVKEQEKINQALSVLRERLHPQMTDKDEQEVREALRTVQEHAPDAFEEIRQVINKTSDSGAAGDMLYSWLASLSSVMPK